MTALCQLLWVLVALSFIPKTCQSSDDQISIIPSDFCLMNNTDDQNSQTISFASNASYECQVIARAPTGKTILLTILSANITNLDYLYVDTVDTSEKRFLAFSGHLRQCNLVLPQDEISVHVRSDAAIELQVADADNSPSALDMQQQQDQCGVMQEYNDKLECSALTTQKHRIQGLEATCQLSCPLKCVCTLYDGEVKYTCANGVTGRYFIIFPPEIDLEFLDFSKSGVAELSHDAFTRLWFVTVLRMTNGVLTSLRDGVFERMEYLINLDLSNNAIHTIEPEVFRDMTNIQILNLRSNNIVHLQDSIFHGLFHVRAIFLQNNKLKSLTENVFRDQPGMILLELSYNNLLNLPPGIFSNLLSMRWLYLNYNFLRELPPDVFHGLSSMLELHLHNNSLKSIESTIFEGVNSLQLLTLDANKLTKISPSIWFKLPNLQRLNISHNHLHDFQGHLFGNLSNLITLDLQFNKLTHLERRSFRDVENTTTVFVDDLSACCYTADAKCITRNPAHPFMTCKRLLPNEALKFFMWLLGFSALICNALVIFRQCKNKQKSKIQLVQKLIIINLAASDFLMGLYMIIITSADAHFGSFFPLHSEEWRGSAACKIASILSITSSEASIFFVTLISIERSLVVLFPFQQYKIGQRSFVAVILTMWTVAITFGIVPTVLSNDKFYEVSQVCIGLPLVRRSLYTQQNVTYTQDWRDTQGVLSINTISGSTSWMHFSIAVFLGLNFLCCLIIFLSYFMIFLTVKKTASHIGRFKESHAEEVQMATRMALVVLTDFFCWMPIIIMGILVQAGAVTLSPTVYAWTVTFLLPINSAVNPFLYTLVSASDVYKADRGTKRRLGHKRLSESGRDPETQRELVSMLPMS